MSISVNNNYSAAIALQNLNNTNTQLQQVQSRISTGLKVASAKDDGAVYAISEESKGQVAQQQAILGIVNQGQSLLSVTLDAGNQITSILQQMLGKAQSATSGTLTTSQVSALDNDFQALASQLTTIVNNATFNGVNLISASGTSVTINTDVGTGTLALTAVNLDVGGLALTGLSLTSTTNAASAITSVQSAITSAAAALGTFGANSRTLDATATFTQTLIDANKKAISNLVDADLAEESARLQSLQIKQQLGTQALSIANNAPQSLLSLFR
jgi:flagellin